MNAIPFSELEAGAPCDLLISNYAFSECIEEVREAYMEKLVGLSKKVGIPFIIDTEGSQVRTGELDQNSIQFSENDEVRIYSKEIVGNARRLSLKPGYVIW